MARHGRHFQQQGCRIHQLGFGQDSNHIHRKRHVANGWVFVDELNLAEIENLPTAGSGIEASNANQTLDLAVAGKTDYQGLIVDLTSSNMLADILEAGDATYPEGIGQLGAGIPKEWVPSFDTTNAKNPIVKDLISHGVINLGEEGTPAAPYSIVDTRAYQIKASGDSRYEIETYKITIEKNKFYRFSVWVKQKTSKIRAAHTFLSSRKATPSKTIRL